MRKIILSLLLIATAFSFNLSMAEAKTAAKSAVKQEDNKKAVKATAYKTTMKWDQSALKIIRKIYSSSVRNAYIKKVESYARRNKIKVITAKVVNSMRE